MSDYSSISKAARELSSQQAGLSSLKRSLRQYRASIEASWKGEDAREVVQAIDLLIRRINAASGKVSSSVTAMNKGVAAKKIQDANRRIGLR